MSDAMRESLSVLRRDFNTLRAERDCLQAENAALVAALDAYVRDVCGSEPRTGHLCRLCKPARAALAAHAARTEGGTKP